MQAARFGVRFILSGLFLIVLASITWREVASQGSQPEAEPPAPVNLFLPLVQQVGTDLSVAGVHLLQGISANGNYAVHIAGRQTEARVFVGTGSGMRVSGIQGLLCGYDGEGTPLGCREADNGPVTAPSQESALDSTLNFILPIDWIRPGFSYHVELDPKNLFPEDQKVNNRYPEAGTQPVEFIPAPSLNLMIVPVEYWPYGSEQVYVPQTDDFSYLTGLPIKVFPVSEVNVEDHLFYAYRPSEEKYNLNNPDGYGWVQLLTDLTAIHAMEDPQGNKNYYGVVNSFEAHNCGNGCITGIGYLGGHNAYATAAGWSGWGAGNSAASETLVHELGHNFGRGHVHCTGWESNPDVNYPYPGGMIGQYGLDPDTGLLYEPDLYADYMSYCDPVWTSDYTFWHIFNYRETLYQQSGAAGQAETALYVSGTIDPAGEVTLRPVYRQAAPAHAREEGAYTLELLGQGRQVLARYPFEAPEIPEAPGFRSFGFFVPDEAGLSGLRVEAGGRMVAERWVEEELKPTIFQEAPPAIENQGDRSALRWAPAAGGGARESYRVRLSRDGGATWQVLGLDLTVPELQIPASAVPASGEAWLEVQASDGVHTSTRVFSIQSNDGQTVIK